VHRPGAGRQAVAVINGSYYVIVIVIGGGAARALRNVGEKKCPNESTMIAATFLALRP
jgi:hypothetical protein